MSKRWNTKRVKRHAEEEPDNESRSNDEVSGLLTKSLTDRSHLTSNAQTVGTMLATIPGILEDHGVSFESISKHLYNFEKSMEGVIENGFTKLAETMKDNGKTLHQEMESLKMTIGDKDSDILETGLMTIAEKVGDNGKTIHQEMESLKKTIGDNGETLHQGMDSMVEKMENVANLEETLHEGFHGITEKLSDKTKIDDTIHDGLHEISEKIETINSYGLSGIIKSLDSHDHPSTFPHGHGVNQRKYKHLKIIFD